jgi:hypothetical protein
MKKVFALLLVSVFAIAMVGCGDDDGGATCDETSVQGCYDDYTACTEGLDATASTYLDDLQACVDDYCTCLEDIGCDMSGYDCGE